MKYISVCSGIEAATVAWHPLGWSPVAFSEIEKFPSAVLAHHYPTVPNLGDMTKFHEWPRQHIELLVGGTPCQAFSVAGLRQGLADPRGNLTLTFLAMVDWYRPRWVVWENVPGVLSDRTNAFGRLLAGLGQLGYGWAYRVLDAQYFGVAQRRRRVFVVANLGDWTRAASVLFEPESLRRNTPPSRESRKGIAPTISARTKGGGGLGTDFDLDGGVIAHALKGEGFDASEDGTGIGVPLWPICENVSPCLGAAAAASSQPNVGNGQGTVVGTLTTRLGQNAMGAPEVDGGHYLAWPKDVAPTLDCAFSKHFGQENQHINQGAGLSVPCFGLQDDTTPKVTEERIGAQRADAGGEGACVAYSIQERAVSENPNAGPQGKGFQEGVAYTLEARHHCQAVSANIGVRRLTPTECERLQGFPDGYTNIPWRLHKEAQRKGISYESLLLSKGIKLREPAGEECPDGPRYKALGNSMAVPCMAWIGKRIAAVDNQGVCLDE